MYAKINLNRLASKYRNYNKLYANFYFSSFPKPFDPLNSAPSPELQSKLSSLEKNQPFFDRLIFFDPDVMASLPRPLQMFDPIVEGTKDIIVSIHELTGLPWWAILGITCSLVRVLIMPLILLQMKRTSKLTAVAPVFIQCKKLTDVSIDKKSTRNWRFFKICYQTIRSQKLKIFRLFFYNIINIPIIINIVWSIRRLMVEDSVKNTSFLWIPSLVGIDPYYIIPFCTVALYYFNFGRFITEENKHTFVSRLRHALQILVILWLPILSNWPCAISMYMFYNAVFTYIQTSLMIHPNFIKYINPKLVIYQYLVRMVEYDKAQSQTLIDAIKTGEESHLEKAITEEILVSQMEKRLKEIENEDIEIKKTLAEKIKQKFFKK